MSAPGRPSTTLVDASFRTGLEGAGGRVLDAVELPPIRTHLLGGRDLDPFGGPSLRYEVASASGGRHTYRVYLPASTAPVYVSKSTSVGGTIAPVTSLLDVATYLGDDEVRHDSRRAVHSALVGSSNHAPASAGSLVMTNATAVRLASAVEASGLTDGLSSRHDLAVLVDRYVNLGVRDGLDTGLWAALRGFEPESSGDSPDSLPVRLAVFLEALADGAPVEWALRRTAPDASRVGSS